MKHTLQPRFLRRGAFTLMEMMLVLGIIGILVGITATLMRGDFMDSAQRTKARSQIQNLEMHLIRFKTETGGLMPTKLEGLVTKPSGLQGKSWKKFADEKDLIDPWGSPYVFYNPGKRNPSGHDVFSVGPDRKEGTDDDVWLE